jgi:hypothetical protein
MGIALGSAVGGAILESGTKIVQERLNPLMADIICQTEEAFKDNSAPYRFTVVILPLRNDENAAATSKLAVAIAEVFSGKRHRTCQRVTLPTAGDREINLEAESSKLIKLFNRYDPDLIILGDASYGGQPRITILVRSAVFHWDGGSKEDISLDSIESTPFARPPE